MRPHTERHCCTCSVESLRFLLMSRPMVVGDGMMALGLCIKTYSTVMRSESVGWCNRERTNQKVGPELSNMADCTPTPIRLTSSGRQPLNIEALGRRYQRRRRCSPECVGGDCYCQGLSAAVDRADQISSCRILVVQKFENPQRYRDWLTQE